MTMRPLIIVVSRKNFGSVLLRGYGLAEGLRAMGVPTSVMQLDEVQLRSVRHSTVMFAKYFDTRLVEMARENHNLVLWNVVDWFANGKSCPDEGLFDGAIFPNMRALNDFGHVSRYRESAGVIGSYADPRWKQARPLRYRIGYLGSRRNIASCYRSIKGLNFEYLNVKSDADEQARFFKRATRYACHFSVHPQSTLDFLYKPNVKVVGAAACGSNIVISRSPSYVETVGPEYPFLTDSDIDSVRDAVSLARSSYRGKLWKTGLEILKEVKRSTQRDRIAKDYVDYLKTLE